MSKLRRVSGEEAIRALERLGFVKVRQKGSHVILKKNTPEGDIGCVFRCIESSRLEPFEASFDRPG
jgi:hypothetical protein